MNKKHPTEDEIVLAMEFFEKILSGDGFIDRKI